MVTGEREKIAERLKDLKSEGEEIHKQIPFLSSRKDTKT